MQPEGSEPALHFEPLTGTTPDVKRTWWMTHQAGVTMHTLQMHVSFAPAQAPHGCSNDGMLGQVHVPSPVQAGRFEPHPIYVGGALLCDVHVARLADLLSV